jgi:phosphomannomutase
MNQNLRLSRHRWEGVYTADFTLAGVHQRCRLLGQFLLTRKWNCLIAHDTRFMSGQFARYVYHALEAQNIRVSLCSTSAPIPIIEFALEQKRADCALIVSAGNRPHWYNGLIVLAPTNDAPWGNAQTPDIADTPLAFPPSSDIPEQAQIDLRTPYLDAVRSTVDIEFIRRSALTVFVDPMNGCASGYIPALIGEGSQTKAIEINRETDPLFSRQPPQPAEANLQRLRKLVKESDSHLGLAISADGRAIGVVDNTGDLVSPVEVTLLVAQYLTRQHRLKGTVVVPQPIEPSAGARNWDAFGLKVEISPDPAARIAELQTQDRHSVLAGATSAGEIILGRHSRSPDATQVAMMLIELTARSSGKFRPLLEELRRI